MAEVMLARGSARVNVGGVEHSVRRDRTTAHADHPIVLDNPDLWRPLPVNFPSTPQDVDVEVPDPGELERYRVHSVQLNAVAWRLAEALGDVAPGDTAVDGDVDELVDRAVAAIAIASAVPDEERLTTPSDVRAWAKAAGIVVPARGKVPPELVEQYKAAHRAPPAPGGGD